MPHYRTALLLAALTLTTAPSLARPGGMGGPAWGASRFDDPWGEPRINSRERDEREGKVDADSFVADDAGDTLGKGAITVITRAGGTEEARSEAAYEAALVDQLVKAGYETASPRPGEGQRAEIRVIRDVLVPEEQKRKPVSGSMTVGTGTHGSMMGMAVAIDLSKPRKALLSTRLEARIIDIASGKPLWEGHAEIATLEGAARWSDQAIATRLAAALFAHFPSGSAGKVASR